MWSLVASAVGAAALLTVMWFPSVASALEPVIPSTVTFKTVHATDGYRATGVVKSQAPKCKDKRVVNIYRKVAGPDRLVIAQKTGPNGDWAVTVGPPLEAGTYYAKIVKTSFAGNSGRAFCAADQSPEVKVPG